MEETSPDSSMEERPHGKQETKSSTLSQGSEVCERCLRYAKKPNRFCSRECYGESIRGNKNRLKHGRFVKKRTCITCDKPTSQNGINCQVCAKAKQTQAIVDSWLDGSWDGNTKHGLSAVVRRFIVNRADNKCEQCGWCEIHPSTGKVPVQVDHIDGDAFNNKDSNLRVLCPNCHSLTPTFGNLNKNGTRKYRYK